MTYDDKWFDRNVKIRWKLAKYNFQLLPALLANRNRNNSVKKSNKRQATKSGLYVKGHSSTSKICSRQFVLWMYVWNRQVVIFNGAIITRRECSNETNKNILYVQQFEPLYIRVWRIMYTQNTPKKMDCVNCVITYYILYFFFYTNVWVFAEHNQF